jgi:dynein heavy chain
MFRAWPQDALVDVAYRYLKEVEMETDELRQAIAEDMAEIHISIDVENENFLKAEKRHNYTTPKSFLEFKDYYNDLL